MKEQSDSTSPLLLKPAEAAKILNVSARKLWSMAASGQIAQTRFGKKCIRFTHDAIQAAIDSNTKGVQS